MVKAPPRHIAIIMDGNGRWAQAKGWPRVRGHRHGVTAVKKVLRAAPNFGVKYVTLYAFSTENFSRPKSEVDFLIKLFERALKKSQKSFIQNKIRFRAIGDLSKFPQSLQLATETLTSNTAQFEDFNVTVAINYGARDEMVRAAKLLLNEPCNQINELSWDTIQKKLYTADLPDPDLVIRTSGEQRLSNFLLLQSAYAELYFTNVMWPDFNEEELAKAIENYNMRERRMGNIYAK